MTGKFLTACIFVLAGYAAQADTLRIAGNIHDADNPFVYVNYFVVNQRSNKGVFGNSRGNFAMICKYSDTIIVSSEGYYTIKITLRDSVQKGQTQAKLRIGLRKKEIVLQPVVIIPDRDLSEIKADLDNVKDPSEIELVTVNPIESPITALYQAFSKLERSKHQVAVMEAEDRKREILKELLSRYVRADIINLNEDQFESFITNGNFNLASIKTMNDYDLIMHVKREYERFKGSYQYYLKQD
ncbi:MAG: hypothetical protein ACHQF2_09055 [Flavobacteriales bacterium]